MTTASEKAWGALRFTGVAQPKFSVSLRDPPTTKRYPDPNPATGREPAAIARALNNLGRKGAPR